MRFYCLLMTLPYYLYLKGKNVPMTQTLLEIEKLSCKCGVILDTTLLAMESLNNKIVEMAQFYSVRE